MKFVQEAESLIESEKKRDIGIQVLEKAINIDPTNPFAFFMLGRAFSKEERYEAAAAAYSEAATYFKNKPNWLLESYLQMGTVYQKISKKEEASESFKRALELDPENSFAQRRLKRLQ
jgi:tetratricopeptide (TPR) repeat protein